MLRSPALSHRKDLVTNLENPIAIGWLFLVIQVPKNSLKSIFKEKLIKITRKAGNDPKVVSNRNSYILRFQVSRRMKIVSTHEAAPLRHFKSVFYFMGDSSLLGWDCLRHSCQVFVPVVSAVLRCSCSRVLLVVIFYLLSCHKPVYRPVFCELRKINPDGTVLIWLDAKPSLLYSILPFGWNTSFLFIYRTVVILFNHSATLHTKVCLILRCFEREKSLCKTSTWNKMFVSRGSR